MGVIHRGINVIIIIMVDFLNKLKNKFYKHWILPWGACYLMVVPFAWADDNHVHVEQVSSGDNLDLNITQIGYDNEINFTVSHSGNVFNLIQNGSGNYIGWVSYWGSGKGWGGDIDGTDNTENIEQWNGATYGRHIWGNNNEVDVYQNGSHTHWLDVHIDYADHEAHQSGTGSHYAHTYYYGTQDGSVASIMQKDTGSHNAQITLTGSQPTTLNLLQQGATNKSYNLTQNCQTVGGCTVSVTQSD